MSTLIILLLCGAAGGFIFEWFGLPGGAMTGAIIAVILLKSFSSLPQAAFPRPFQFCIYAGLGVLVGNMAYSAEEAETAIADGKLDAVALSSRQHARHAGHDGRACCFRKAGQAGDGRCRDPEKRDEN